jgi:hypothetical protein
MVLFPRPRPAVIVVSMSSMRECAPAGNSGRALPPPQW